MTGAVVETAGLGKQYGSIWALQDCSVTLPAGRVVALVGPNGAGKTTLLKILVGLMTPTTGSVRVLGAEASGRDAALLARVGYVAQETPLYRTFSVRDMVSFGRHMNPRFDDEGMRRRLEQLEIPLDRQCGRLSGGQQSQVALALALAKRPELLILDEPVARLDPLARHEFLETLMEAVADTQMTVLLSSHLIADLEHVCDHLLLVMAGRLQVAGDIDDLLRTHHLVKGPRDGAGEPSNGTVVERRDSDRQTQLLVRGDAPVAGPDWEVTEVGLEQLVLGYLRQGGRPPKAQPRRTSVEVLP